jgi:hypothetical protein
MDLDRRSGVTTRRNIRMWISLFLAGVILPCLALSAVGGRASAAPTRYEAEDAVISQGTVASDHTGYTGTGFVDYTNVSGSYVEFTVDAAQAGSTALTFRFANGTTADRPMDISVNGTTVAAGVSFPGTGAWTSWQGKSVSADLAAGGNVVRATATTANGGPNLDSLTVSPRWRATRRARSAAGRTRSACTCTASTSSTSAPTTRGT